MIFSFLCFFVCLIKVKDQDSNDNFTKFKSAVEKLAESIDTMEAASFDTVLHTFASNTAKEHEKNDIDEQKKVNALR